MNSKTYSVRVSDDLLNEEIAAYAATHGVAESTAFVRLCIEGRNARTGKPITRFAVSDPQAEKHYNLALGQLRELSRTLRRCITALRVPRPLTVEEQVVWAAEKKQAADAFAAVHTAINALKHAGRLEVLLHGVKSANLESLYRQGIDKGIRSLVVVFGALLGKPLVAANPETVPTTTPPKTPVAA
jgi:hypothetical protein